jgi:hypothetical protein
VVEGLVGRAADVAERLVERIASAE